MSAVVVDQVYSDSRAIASENSLEAQLVERIRLGDRIAFEQMVRMYQQSVYNLIYRIIGDAEETKDLAQETFLKVYQKIDQFRGEANLKTWVLSIATNQAANHRRWWVRRWRHRTLSIDEPLANDRGSLMDQMADHQPSTEQTLIEREKEDRLSQALLKLKPAYRVAVVLRDIEGYSYEEIASVLKVSVGTVKSRISRGREFLRKEMIKDPCWRMG